MSVLTAEPHILEVSLVPTHTCTLILYLNTLRAMIVMTRQMMDSPHPM